MVSVVDVPRSIWHVAFIVDNLEDAMADLSFAIGTTWGELHPVDATLDTDAGLPERVRTRAVFSQNLPCAIELIESCPGTVLSFQGESSFHHMGVWSADMAADGTRLRAAGWPCLGANRDRISLHRGPSHITVELCNLGIDRPGLEQFYPAQP